MKNLFLVIAISFLLSKAIGQVYQPIQFPEKIEKKYVFNTLEAHEKYKGKLKNKIPKKYLEEFSYSQVSGKTEMFSGGEIYLSWEAMESYVNKMLDSIMPANLASKKIRAYISRNSSINAYCLYDGTMIVNVGLIAEAKSEAALAAIMGHELAHFQKNHHITNFKNSLKAKKKSKSALQAELMNKKFSQENEMEADMVGYDIAKSANYDLSDALSNFELFIREEEYYQKRNKSMLANTDSVSITTSAGKYKVNTLEKLISSHPDMKERKDKLQAYIKSNPQNKKIKYKMSEQQFAALQKQARLECVSLLFEEHNYNECLERSFLYYLMNPEEISYSYYNAESIRRLCLFDYRLRKKGFLAENLTNNGFKEGQGILHDIKFMVPNQDVYNAIKAKDLLNTSTFAFETYKEAFYYFTKKMIEKDLPEAYLSQALFENNKDKIRENITKYVSYPKAKHKDYANCYMNKTLGDRVLKNTKELVMIPRINFYGHTAFANEYPYGLGNTIYYYKKSELLGSEMANEFADKFNADVENVKAISLPMATTQNFNTKHKYESVIKATLMASRDENEGYEVVHYYKELEDEDYIGNMDIYRLDPEVWEFFINNSINTISYSNYTRHYSRAGKKMRNLWLIFAIPSVGFTGILAAGTAVNYKKLSLYSFNPSFGALYFDYYVKARKISSKSAVKMFNRLKIQRDDYVKEYNNKYQKK
ncbi:MAG: M48 family metallopeptidase [Sphingobacteriaceae bacterium]